MKQKHGEITDDQVLEAFQTYGRIGEMAAALQVPYVTVHRRCAKLGLEVQNGGQNKGRPRIRFATEDILNGLHPQYPTLKLKKRLVQEGYFEECCQICKIENWNEKPLVFQLDHINGISTDHALENLRLLCPNCHSQTDTWCGKNNG